MGTPFIGQLMLASFNFAPKNWVMANGQLMAINQNQALFSLFGTTYGGNGQTTFGLPNLQGRTPISQGNGHVLGEIAGQDTHTLIQSEVPQHTHLVEASTSTAGLDKPTGNLLATTSSNATVYTAFGNATAMAPGCITQIGGSQPHENRQPYLVMTWVVSLSGIFPSRS